MKKTIRNQFSSKVIILTENLNVLKQAYRQNYANGLGLLFVITEILSKFTINNSC